MGYLQVAIPLGVAHCFDYRCLPDTNPKSVIGARVQVPFGKKHLIGVVISSSERSDIEDYRLKSILKVLDGTPLFDSDRLEFAKWLSAYYHYPIGETLFLMMPTLLRQGHSADADSLYKAQVHWRLKETHDTESWSQSIKVSAYKQRQAIDLLREHTSLSQSALGELGITSTTLKSLARKQLIESFVFTVSAVKERLAYQGVTESALVLNQEQSDALATIVKAIDDRCYQGILLNGVTGSGKTEVYLQAIDRVLSLGKQTLVLVPEIGLTPQTKERFVKRFGAQVVVLHSGMNDKERLAGFLACKHGTAGIVVATRSSVLYDFADLGLIIVDEAHDPAYKQQDHLRYRTCDVALYLGHRRSIPVVLATATPSLEQLRLVTEAKLAECKLNERANAKPPSFEMIDLRLEQGSYQDMTGELWRMGLASQTLTAMRQTLDRGEQVMVFLNRRGFAPIVLCQSCGHQLDCARCSSHLTLHRDASWHHDWLKCHHCAYQMPLPSHCPECQSPNLKSLGQGTAQLTKHLKSVFDNPQRSHRCYPVVQIDRDTVSKKGAWQVLYDEIQTAAPMILVGTQMIAKGHHFAGVTLVVVVDADAGFLSPDFRAPEHTAQTIIQVAGRAGRADRAGRVLIQSYQPDRSEFIKLIHQGYGEFAKDLLDQRARLGLPPFRHGALIQAEAMDENKVNHAICDAHALLQEYMTEGISLMSPSQAPLYKRNNRYHMQIFILADARKDLHRLLNDTWQRILALNSVKMTKMTLDIDPMGF